MRSQPLVRPTARLSFVCGSGGRDQKASRARRQAKQKKKEVVREKKGYHRTEIATREKRTIEDARKQARDFAKR
ncbi:hypothetical protein pdul_cds_995 [Pandoravirus dulcis]|uniref:Uncharacterized protein n=1 Tax=Pandoravirus dulcis TaxID=1349409 RepID=S4VYW8_9VIRU|nr:hypothetical protein pdul_cds_995 [Pandoravirus dulcis]AGO83256.1 hypothetical protein pdul_cds_995 [Pandoravirus dulcis]